MNILLKKTVSIFASAAMVVSLVPSVAFAGSENASTGGAQEPVPTEYSSFVNADGTFEKSTDVKYKWLEYEDDETGQVGWGQVEVAKATVDSVTYYFVTDPDPKHVNEVTCTYVDFPSSASNICLNIPERITLDGTVYTTTAIGNSQGSSYLAPGSEENVDLWGNADTSLDVDKHMVSYWYGTSVQGFPRWFMYQAYPSDKTYKNAAQLKERHKNTAQDCSIDGEFASYVSQHPYVDGYGSNDNIFTANYSAMYVKDDQGKWNIWRKAEAVAEVVIPETVRSLGGSSFRGCKNLAKATFAGNSQLTYMGHQVFEDSILTSLELPSGLETITNISYYRHRSYAFDTGYGDDYRNANERGWGRYVDVDDSVEGFTEDTFLDSVNYTTKDKAIERKSQTSGYKEYDDRTGQGRFAGLSKLETLTIGGGTDLKINHDASKGIAIGSDYLSALKSITIVGENEDYCTVDNIMYNKQKTALVYVPKKLTGNVTLSDEITDIGNKFKGTDITSITFGRGLTKLEFEALGSCKSLKNVVFQDSMKNIGSSAFVGCTALEKIRIPDSIEEIGGAVFKDCTSLTDVYLPDSITSMGGNFFSGCTSLAKVNLPSSLETMGTGFFYNCTSLKEINIPSGVSSFGMNVFMNDTSLEKIVFNHPGKITFTSTNYSSFTGQKVNPLEKLTLVFASEKADVEDTNGITFGSNFKTTTKRFFLANELDIYTFSDKVKEFFTTESNLGAPTSDGNTVKAVCFVPETDSVADQVYTGSAIEPSVTVKNGEAELIAGEDYTVSYSNNIKPGTAKATVDYNGAKKVVAFDIVALDEDTTAASVVDDAIAALPAAGSVTLADKAAVEAAYASFEKLTDAQKLLVDNGSKLLAAMKAVSDLQSAADAKASSDQAAELQKQIDTLKEQLADAKAQAVTSVTVNAKTVTASAVAKAVSKAGGKAKYVTSITLGSKVKTIKKGAFKACKKVKTVTVKTKKLTKKSVKGAFRGSKVKTVQVPKKCVKKYKKFMTKKVVGKKVAVTQ